MVHFKPTFTAPNYIVLSIPSSKTDPFQKGTSLFIPTVPGASTFPVTSLKQLYTLDPRPPESPLFIVDDGLPLLHGDLIRRLCKNLSSLGLNAPNYVGHSFRQGGASLAAAVGGHDFELQQLGHWCSDAYKLYIEPNHLHLLSLSVCLHWAVPNTQPPQPLSLHFVPQLA